MCVSYSCIESFLFIRRCGGGGERVVSPDHHQINKLLLAPGQNTGMDDIRRISSSKSFGKKKKKKEKWLRTVNYRRMYKSDDDGAVCCCCCCWDKEKIEPLVGRRATTSCR